MKLNIIDQIIIAVTSIYLFVHVKTLLVKPDFLFNGIIGIWIAISIFDAYAHYRARQWKIGSGGIRN